MGFPAQVAAKFHQRPAVVITLAVEEPVQALLNPFFYGLEEQSRDNDCNHQPSRSSAGKAGVDYLGGGTNGSEVHPYDGGGGEGVSHAALEDDVHIHQAVAHDGVAEGERQENQRKYCEPYQQGRSSSSRTLMQVWQYAAQGKKRKRHEYAARDQ